MDGVCVCLCVCIRACLHDCLHNSVCVSAYIHTYIVVLFNLYASVVAERWTEAVTRHRGGRHGAALQT